MTILNDYEFRPIRSGEMKQFLGLQRYVFAGDPAPSKEKREQEDKNLLEREEPTAAFYKGKLVATFGQFSFRMRFNGKDVRADGVTSVGTEPSHRRKGLVRRLVTDRLHKAHEEGIPASILWASMGAIYQRFGYGLASSGYKYQFDPRETEFQFGAKSEDGYVTSVWTRRHSRGGPRTLRRVSCATQSLVTPPGPLAWEHAYYGPKPNYHYAVRYDGSGKPRTATFPIACVKFPSPQTDQTRGLVFRILSTSVTRRTERCGTTCEITI